LAVSPDCKAVLMEFSAFSNGFDDDPSAVAPAPGGVGGRLAAM
jgi:hypothetical protein